VTPSPGQSLEVATGSTRIHALSVSGRAALVAVILTIASLGQVTAGESTASSRRGTIARTRT